MLQYLPHMKTILTSSKSAVKDAIKALEKGQLVVFPTETCYGVAVDATNPLAISKLLEFKGQRSGKAISIAVDLRQMAEEYVEINTVADNLYNNFLPGPITVVSNSRGEIDKRLVSSNNTLGIRIPDHRFTLQLIHQFGRPITATSANSSGRKPPYSIEDFNKYNTKKSLSLTDLFLDDGVLPNHLPSTILDTTLQEPKVLRSGEIKLDSSATTYISRSVKDTIAYAKKLINNVLTKSKTPLIIALQGDLGTGKTHFAKGVALALGVKGTITSPTYTIIKEYNHSEGTLYHIDTWRLEDPHELSKLGLREMLRPGNIIVIEWIEKINKKLKVLSKKHPILWVKITPTTRDSRSISHKLELPK